MSPADAKRGAKRRKNKRGGGGGGAGGGHGGAGGGKAGPAAALRGSQAAGLAAPGGAAAANGPLGAGGAAPGGYFETPFNFGVNHRTPPYPAGDYCLLCRSERKDASFSESGIKAASRLALSTAPKGNSVLHLPLWVCPDCRRAVEKEERPRGLDQPAGQDFLLHAPLGGSQVEAGGGRLALGTQPLPSDAACACEACSERRETSADAEREPQPLRSCWSEVRYMVRCIYRQAGTPLADDQDQSLVPDKDGVQELVDRYRVPASCPPRLCWVGPLRVGGAGRSAPSGRPARAGPLGRFQTRSDETRSACNGREVTQKRRGTFLSVHTDSDTAF